MNNTLIFAGIIIILVTLVILAGLTIRIYARLGAMTKTQTLQYNLIVKMQTILKTKTATNAVAEHAELIYQDLLQNLIPVMAAIDVMPRQTPEHPLWRALGGILDEYAKNPFALEKLRRAIKLDPEVARSIDNYTARADNLLRQMTTNEPDGILAATFTDGLLGQSLTFFTQARQLAMQGN